MVSRGRFAGLFGLVLVGLLLAACTGGGGQEAPAFSASTEPGSAAGSEPSSAAGPETASAPPPLSASEYQALLSSTSRRIRDVLAKVEHAGTYDGLRARVDRAERVLARELDRLSVVSPPEDVAGLHTQLVGALGGLAKAVGKAGGAVDSQALCGAPSVIGRLGATEAAAALRRVTRRVRAAGYALTAVAPRRVSLPNRRLATGELTSAFQGSGRGELTVDNGLDLDGVVTLTQRKEAVATAYVRRKDTVAIDGVPDGTYRVFFTVGRDWDEALAIFTRTCRFERFDESLAFTTTETATMITWSTYTLTLHPVAGGTASTSSVAPGEFPG